MDYKTGQYCIIEDGVTIGKGTVIGDYVKILSGTVIGDNCYIGDRTLIEGSELKDNVHLQGNNRIGSRCVLHKGVKMKYGAILTSDAVIDENVFLGVLSVTLGSDVDGKQVKGTYIYKDSYIGGQAQIAPGLKIDEKITLGANAYLIEFNGSGTYVGTPAKKKK